MSNESCVVPPMLSRAVDWNSGDTILPPRTITAPIARFTNRLQASGQLSEDDVARCKRVTGLCTESQKHIQDIREVHVCGVVSAGASKVAIV
jgi:hypothetical protein